MAEIEKGKASICVVNYRTLEFTRLCLRSIRRFTNYPHEIIVVDNDSRDESLDYLRSLKWIRLIERRDGNPKLGGYSHAAALDLALENCTGEFFVAMHSDTFICRDNWLGMMLNYFDAEGNVACVGTGKLEVKSAWLVLLKKVTDVKKWLRFLKGSDSRQKLRHYNRPICTAYRTEVLQKEHLSFLADRDKGMQVGQKLYFDLVDSGYRTVRLRPQKMMKYVVHLAHATQFINPQQFSLRSHTRKKCSSQLEKIMSSELTQQILNDASLDK